VAPYSFRSVSRKFCPRARLVVLHATRVVDVVRVASLLKLRRDIHVPSLDCRLVARGN
jgi:hypothetical protein